MESEESRDDGSTRLETRIQCEKSSDNDRIASERFYSSAMCVLSFAGIVCSGADGDS